VAIADPAAQLTACGYVGTNFLCAPRKKSSREKAGERKKAGVRRSESSGVGAGAHGHKRSNATGFTLD